MSTGEFATRLKTMSDEEICRLVDARRQHHHVEPGIDPEQAAVTKHWLRQADRELRQHHQSQPEQDTRLATTGFVDEYVGALADEIGSATGALERELRKDIKSQSERIQKLEDDNAFLKTQLATLRAAMDGKSSVKLIEGKAHGKVA